MDTWANLLWSASWQGGLFILVVALVCRLWSRMPPAARCWLWWLACLKLVVGLIAVAPLALPVPPAALSALPLPVVVSSGLSLDPVRSADLSAGQASSSHGAVPRTGANAPQQSRPLRPATSQSGENAAGRYPTDLAAILPGLGALLSLIWATGVLLRLRRAALLYCAARRLLQEARPLEDAAISEQAAQLADRLGLRRPPPLLVSPAAPGPLVAGLLRPAIVLPATAAAPLSPAELRMALAHELAHLRRGDLWLALVPGLAQALFWFHPLVGLACREWATAREAACDADALAVTDAPAAAYGRFLVKIAASGRGAAVLPALGTASDFRTLQRRLQMLRDLSSSPRRWMRATLALTVILGALAALPWRVTAAETGRRVPAAVLADVKALDKPVTYTETKIPLGELVEKVADDTGAPLTAVPEVADEPVAVVVKEMPARDLLARVAELLDYRWTRRLGLKGWRYEIYQDVAARQREEAQRQATFGEVEQRFREEVARHVEIASLPPAEIQRLQAAGERRSELMKKLAPSGREAFRNRPGERERGERYGLATRMAAPVTRGMAQLIGRLTPAHWEKLRQGDALTFATDPQPGELSLPAGLAAVFRAAKPDMASGFSYGPGEIGERERQREAEDAEKWKAATGYRVRLRMDMGEFRSRGSLTLQAEARAVRTGAPPRVAAFQGGQGTRLWISADPYLGDIVQPEDTAARHPQIAKDPVFGAKKPFKPEPLAPPNHLGVLPRFRNSRMLANLLPDLARAYGVQIIADAYRTVPRVGTRLPSEPVALYALLDRLAAGTLRWEHRGDVALVRSRTWFFDRPREIPLRFVRRWKELGERYGLLPLDECIAAVNALPDVQLEPEVLSGAIAEAGLFDLGSSVFHARARNALRLYGALAPAQRQALWQGKPLPVAQMTPRQRELFVAAIREYAREIGEPPDLRHLAGGSFSLNVRAAQRTLTTHGTLTRFQYERVKPPDSPPEGPPTGKRVTTRDGVTRYRMLTMTFRLDYGAGLSAHAQMDVAL